MFRHNRAITLVCQFMQSLISNIYSQNNRKRTLKNNFINKKEVA